MIDSCCSIKYLTPNIILAQRRYELLIFVKTLPEVYLLYLPAAKSPINNIDDILSFIPENHSMKEILLNIDKQKNPEELKHYSVELVHFELSKEKVITIRNFLSKNSSTSMIIHLEWKNPPNDIPRFFECFKELKNDTNPGLWENIRYMIHFQPLSSTISSILNSYPQFNTEKTINLIMNLTDIDGMSIDELEEGLIKIEESGFSFPCFLPPIESNDGSLMKKIIHYCVRNCLVKYIIPWHKSTQSADELFFNISNMWKIWDEYYHLWINDNQKPFLILEPIRKVVDSFLSLTPNTYSFILNDENHELFEKCHTIIKMIEKSDTEHESLHNSFKNFVPYQYIQKTKDHIKTIPEESLLKYRDLYGKILQFVLNKLFEECRNAERYQSLLILDLTGSKPSFRRSSLV